MFEAASLLETAARLLERPPDAELARAFAWSFRASAGAGFTYDALTRVGAADAMICPLPSIQRDRAADAERDGIGAMLPRPVVPGPLPPPLADALLSEKVLFSTVAVPLL